MTHSVPIRRNRRKAVPPSEEGYVLLAAIFFLALLVISLAVAAPQVAKSIRRDREVEAFHRGMQYRRAIQLYYRKYHSYPPSIDALVKTQEIRFLRKKYSDPITGKDDWKPVPFGQNKAPVALGFFGEPLVGNPTTMAGTGPSGGNNSSGMPFGGSGSGFGSSSAGFGNSGSSIGGGGSMGFSSSGNGNSTPGATAGTQSTPGTPGTTGTPGPPSNSDQSSQSFGGVGIIGFSPGSSNQSILVYKKKNHYNEWEFTYDPISDVPKITGGNNGLGNPAGTNPAGTNPAATGTSGNGINSGIGGNGQNGTGGFSFGPSPSQPTPSAPSSPQ